MTQLIPDYFIAGDPWAKLPPSSNPMAIQGNPRDTGLQRSRCDCWNIGSFPSCLVCLFCSVGKIEEKPRLANPNATFLSQELDGDGKSDDAVANDQPTGSSIVLLPGCQLRFDE